MHKIIAFADGENLTFRYQEMVKKGKFPANDVVHIPDLLVWHPKITTVAICDIVRIYYYQTCTGDQQKIERASDQIAAVPYLFNL